MKGRGPRGMKREPAVRFTQVEINGLNGAGEIDLSEATLNGPFAPEEGDLVISILVVSGVFHKFDDATEFASVVGHRATLRQHTDTDRSAISHVISFARVR